MRLVIATPSPYARKARIALLEKGLPFDVVVDNPWKPDTGIAALNPLAKVPALVLDDGGVVHDSKVIVEWLEALAPSPALLPADPLERARARLVEAVADGLCDAVVLIVLERARPPEKRSEDWIARQRRKVAAGVAELERLLDGRPRFLDTPGPLAGPDGLGLAEIAAACALGYADLRLPEHDWRTEAPSLLRLVERLDRRPSFAGTRPVAQPVAIGG